MESLIGLSYQQVKANGDEAGENFHHRLLTNVEFLENNVGGIDKFITKYLDAVKTFCGAGSQLSEAFSSVFKDTPLLEISDQLKQVVEETKHAAHKSSVLITNHVLETLCEFTSTFPGLKRAIEVHKRSVENLESCKENVEVLEKDESCETKRLQVAKDRLQAATDELSKEEEKLSRCLSEVEENRVKMLGACFLSLMQAQGQFLQSASDLISPLGGYREIGEYLRDREITPALKEATATWISAARANQSLQQLETLSREDTQLLLQCSQGEDIPEATRRDISWKIDRQLQLYKQELEHSPTENAEIPAGFSKNPRGIELALQGCCSDLERRAAGGFHDVVTPEEMDAQIQREISSLQIKIGDKLFEPASPSKNNDHIKLKSAAIKDLVNSVAKQHDIPMTKDTSELFSTMVLNEACTPGSLLAAKTAVQLLFGKANLVTIKPSPEMHTRLAQVYITGTSIAVEVSSSWWVAEDVSLFSSLMREFDNGPLGVVDTAYIARFSLMDYLEDKERSLPVVVVQRRNNPVSPMQLRSKAGTTSPSHKHRSLRKSLSRAKSKLFTRKLSSSSSSKPNSQNISPTVEISPSWTPASTPATAVRVSVASSNDTNPSTDTDMEEIPPIRPPRPRHQARKSKSQADTNTPAQDTEQTEEIEEIEIRKEKEQSKDWFTTNTKFPLPVVKPSSCSSQLSLASHEELEEVINFLSGVRCPPRRPNTLEQKDTASESMYPMSDSGIGSVWSVASSNITTATADASTPVHTSSPQQSPNKAEAAAEEGSITETKTLVAAKAVTEDKPTEKKAAATSPVPEVTVSTTEKPAKKETTETEPVLQATDTDSAKHETGSEEATGTEDGPCEVNNLTDEGEEKSTPENNTDSPANLSSPPVTENTTTVTTKTEPSITVSPPPAPVPPPLTKLQDISCMSMDIPIGDSNISPLGSLSPMDTILEERKDTDLSQDHDALALRETIRNVWEQAEKSIPADKCDSLSINLPLETPLSKRNEHFGSSDSIYHSCWSLNDFPLDKTTDRELTQSRPEVVTSLAGGVKWSSGYDDELSGNQGNRSPWDDHKSGTVPCTNGWYGQGSRSFDETKTRSAGGGSVFSLGLGITGPELFAVARQGSTMCRSTENLSTVSKPTQNKANDRQRFEQGDPWMSREWPTPYRSLWDHPGPGPVLDDMAPTIHPRGIQQRLSESYLPRHDPMWAQYPPYNCSPVRHSSQLTLQRQYSMDPVRMGNYLKVGYQPRPNGAPGYIPRHASLSQSASLPPNYASRKK